MSGEDLLVLIPWVIFAAGVTTIILMAGNRDGQGRRRCRRGRRRQPRR